MNVIEAEKYFNAKIIWLTSNSSLIQNSCKLAARVLPLPPTTLKRKSKDVQRYSGLDFMELDALRALTRANTAPNPSYFASSSTLIESFSAEIFTIQVASLRSS